MAILKKAGFFKISKNDNKKLNNIVVNSLTRNTHTKEEKNTIVELFKKYFGPMNRDDQERILRVIKKDSKLNNNIYSMDYALNYYSIVTDKPLTEKKLFAFLGANIGLIEVIKKVYKTN